MAGRRKSPLVVSRTDRLVTATDGTPPISLCFRCEHRARFLEQGGSWRPRHQCGEPDKSISQCYMFAPVVPPCTARISGDSRPEFGPAILAARREPVPMDPAIRLRLCVGERANRRDRIFFWAPEMYDGDTREKLDAVVADGTLPRHERSIDSDEEAPDIFGNVPRNPILPVADQDTPG